MAEFLNISTVEETKRMYEQYFQAASLSTEKIPILESLNRILAEDVISEVNLPAFARSIMDGYAVKAEDVFGVSLSLPAYLEICGEVLMGQEPEKEIKKGQAMKIATGGMIPPGADTVVMVEYTEKIAPNQIEVKKSMGIGENVVQMGDDIKRGGRLLPKGRKIQSQDIGAMAAIGVVGVKVCQPIRVGIISTGDELVSPQALPEPGRVRDVNSYLLSSKVSEIGGQPSAFGIVRDDSKLIQEAVLELIPANDLILISGGSSVGTRDLVLDALQSLGEVLVHGVAIKPGKPVIIAKVQGKPVFGLPGHPASGMVIFIVLVLPLIDQLQGAISVERHIKAITTRSIPSVPGREDYIRVRLQWSNGQYLAHPIFGKSGLIMPMIKSDGLLRIPLDSEGLDEGEEIEVLLL